MDKVRKNIIKCMLIFILLFVFFAYPRLFFFPYAKVSADAVERVDLIVEWPWERVSISDLEEIQRILDEVRASSITGIPLQFGSRGGTNLQEFVFYLRNGEEIRFSYDVEGGAEDRSRDGWEMTTLDPHGYISFRGDLPLLFLQLMEKYYPDKEGEAFEEIRALRQEYQRVYDVAKDMNR